MFHFLFLRSCQQCRLWTLQCRFSLEQAIPPHLTLMECGEFGFNNFNLILRSLHIFKNDCMYFLICPHLCFSLIWIPNFKAINFYRTRAKEQASWWDLFESLWFWPWIWKIPRQHMFFFALRRFLDSWRVCLNFLKALRIQLHNKCCTKKIQHGPTRYILNTSKKYRNICTMTTIFKKPLQLRDKSTASV